MERPKLNRVWASGSDSEIKDPGDSKYEEGWVAEIPTYQVLNYLQNKIDKTLLSLGERGVFEWGSDVAYKLNSLVWNEIDGKIYVALVDSPNTSLTPDTNLSQWGESSIQITRTEFDALNTKITNHINSLGGTNPHELGPHDVDTYSRSEIDDMVSTDSTANEEHIENRDNPHQTTADKAGAVPVTGGEYTGTITMGSGVTNLDSTGTSKIDATGDVLGIVVGTSGLGVDESGNAGLLAEGAFTPFGDIVEKDTDNFLQVKNNLSEIAAAGATAQSTSRQNLGLSDTEILQKIYTIGQYYESETDDRNPADILGFGTWESRSGLLYGVGKITDKDKVDGDGNALSYTINAGAVQGRLYVTEANIATTATTAKSGAIEDHVHNFTYTNYSNMDADASGSGAAGDAQSHTSQTTPAGGIPDGITVNGSIGTQTEPLLIPGYAAYRWVRTA